MTHWADPKDVEAKTADWSAAQLACRLNKYHDWTDVRLTMISRHPGGVMTVHQRCGRGCGVGRKTTMNAQGRLLAKWRPDYSSEEAKKHLMRDSEGKSLGRIGEDGMAVIRLMSWAGVTVTEVEELA